MLSITFLIGLTFLPGSFGLLDEIPSLGCHIPTEGWVDNDCHQNIALAHFQVPSPPESFSSFDLVSRSISQAGDHLGQSTASYLLDNMDKHWPNAMAPPSYHFSNDVPPDYFSQVLGSHSYPFPQQPMRAPEGPHNCAVRHADSQNMESHIKISRSEREALDSIASYLFDEETSDPPLQTTSPPRSPHGVSPNQGSGLDLLPQLATSPAWTTTFPEVRHEAYFPIAIFESEPNLVVLDSLSDNQPNDGFQGFPRDSKKKLKISSSAGLDKRVKNDRKAVRKTLSRLKSTKTKNHSTYTSSKNVCSTRDIHAPKSIAVISEHISELESSSYAFLIDQATRLQRSDDEKMVMMERTEAKWLPFYQKYFEFEPKNCEIKAKLNLIFEQLWYMNTCLLHSFDFEVLKNTEYLHCGHDHMMSWVVRQMLTAKGALPASAPNQPQWAFSIIGQKGVLKYFYDFLRAERQNESIFITRRKKSKVVKVSKETVLACEWAIYILELYYKLSNPERFLDVFRGHGNITRRLENYAQARRFDNMKKWRTTVMNMYGKVILPWCKLHLFHFSMEGFYVVCSIMALGAAKTCG